MARARSADRADAAITPEDLLSHLLTSDSGYQNFFALDMALFIIFIPSIDELHYAPKKKGDFVRVSFMFL